MMPIWPGLDGAWFRMFGNGCDVTQRAIRNVHSITLEIETADHDNPLPGIRQPFTS